MEKSLWFPNAELIFTYNFMSNPAFTLLPRTVEIHASASEEK